MKVLIKLHAGLSGQVTGFPSNKEIPFEVTDQSQITPRILLSLLNIEESNVKMVVVNERRANLDIVLHEGDKVFFFPPMYGG